MKELTKEMPAVALRGMTILPSMIVHFDISREKSIKAVEKAMLENQEIFVVTQRDAEAEEPEEKDLYRVGTVVTIKQLMRLPQNIIRVLVEGTARAELLEMDGEQGYLQAKVAVLDEQMENAIEPHQEEGMLRALKEIYGQYALANPKVSKELTAQLMDTGKLSRLVDDIAINLPLYYEEKQKILEAVHLPERYELLCVILGNEVEIMKIKTELQEKIRERIDRNQKEYMLREQLKVIREELGEDTLLSDADRFREMANRLKAPKSVKEKILKEIEHFKNVAGNVSESAVSRSYIETLLELPWDKACLLYTSPSPRDTR